VGGEGRGEKNKTCGEKRKKQERGEQELGPGKQNAWEKMGVQETKEKKTPTPYEQKRGQDRRRVAIKEIHIKGGKGKAERTIADGRKKWREHQEKTKEKVAKKEKTPLLANSQSVRGEDDQEKQGRKKEGLARERWSWRVKRVTY